MTVEAAARRRPWWRLPLLLGTAGLAVFELRGHLPSAASTWSVLQQAQVGWLLAAVVLQVVSMSAFAEQQRSLLRAFGVRMSAGVSLATSYARTAMATALPAGEAVSAAFAFRQFRGRGASQPIAAAVTVLTGVASLLGLLAIYAGNLLFWTGRPVRLAIAAGGLLLVLAAWRWMPRRARPVTVPAADEPAGLLARVRRTLRETVAMAGTVPARRWLVVVGLSALNWLTDLACLLAALHTVGLSVPVKAVAVGYLAAQVAKQIPLTPGGIGVIEAALIVALTAGGAPVAGTTAAVLVYRLLSCWALLPVRLACWAGLRRTPVTS